MHRGRLFRKYFLLILGLVCGTLLLSGGIGLYFAYQENKEALASLQREKAAGAAARIEQFVSQIEQQLAFAALPQLGAEGLEQRRIEFLKLLRVVPAVTDIAQIDSKGREQLAVSRLKMDTAGANEDRSQEPAFKNARPGQTWFGPVYFRKETEPYMSIAVRSGGASGPVTVAEVNLKFIWDVVTRIKIGQRGKAYVVDSTGYLVADPDIGLVLRKTSLSHLEQVKAAFAPGADESFALVAKDMNGKDVLTAYAPIEPGREAAAQGKPWSPLGWKVFVEQPASEVFEALDATILRTVVLIVAGLVFSAAAALWLARSMARPIGVLQEGAQRIGEGNLEQRIDIRTGDELEALAAQFNRMTEQLRESYAGLERKVEARTAELKETLDQQTATSEILKVISSSTTDTQPVFEAIVQSGLKLFPGATVLVTLPENDHVRLAAVATERAEDVSALREGFPIPLTREYMHPVAILDRRVIDLADAAANTEPALAPGLANFLATGQRAITIMPMLRGGAAIGTISVVRRAAGALTEKQVALLRTFADQAVIAIENVRLFNETKEALEQQTAISEILRVISSSPGDVQPVLQAVAERAARICGAPYSDIVLTEGSNVRVAAATGDLGRPSEAVVLDRRTVMGRSIVDRTTVHVADLQSAGDEFPLGRELAQKFGHHTILGVPLVRGDKALGTILLRRTEVRPFEEKYISLLKTFADQAAIAIENARLFNETKESLEQQTATSDILKVISSSATDVQPVLEAIVRSAAQLFAPCNSYIFMRDAGLVRLRAMAGASLEARQREDLARVYPVPFDPDVSTSARAMAERRINVCTDTEAPEVPEHIRKAARAAGFRSNTVVPLVREDEGIGTIVLTHPEPGYALTDKQLALLRTFADQAVIAIENVRLFNETRESLEQQTATSEILRVISDSPGEVKPILEAVAERGTRLCDSAATAIYVLEGTEMRRAAFHGREELLGRESVPYSAGTLIGRAVVEGKPIHVHDIEQAQAEYPLSWEFARQFGRRQTMLAVPLLREGKPFGTMFLRRREVRSFTDRQIALAKVFADQAAIGIQNVRLFNETREALEQQKASAEILGTISSSIADTQPVFDKILQSCERLFAGKQVGINLMGDDGKIRIGAYHGPGRAELERLSPFPKGEGSGSGLAIATGRVVHYPDATASEVPETTRNGLRAIGVKAAIFAPMMWEGGSIGVIFVGRDFVGPFSEKEVALLRTFADQAVIAIQNARLFREIQEKSAQLEIANKHKSEFLANMSHELRTPLNAIIGFSEVLSERMFGEVNEKQADYLKDIHESGKHLLSLINDILDLSKIEAGRMDLEVSTFDLPSALSNAMTLVRERAQRHGIELSLKVDKRLGAFQADERKFKQIVLNLLSNAVKFTPDGGKVDVSAQRFDGKIEVAVRDTGIGIAPEDQASVFEEFKQVGRDYTKKAEGTGLGLTLTKRFVELHGGSIALKSAPGKGSTFTVSLPIRQ